MIKDTKKILTSKNILYSSLHEINKYQVPSTMTMNVSKGALGEPEQFGFAPNRLTTFEPIGSFTVLGLLNKRNKQYLNKFINLCTKHGNKNKSSKIISKTLQRLSVSEGPIGLLMLIKAIQNVKPILEVKRVRISGTTQLVPAIIPKNRQICIAIRWIIEAAILRNKTKKTTSLEECFAAEILDAFRGVGAVKKRRDDNHKLAEANRGFAHYRWW